MQDARSEVNCLAHYSNVLIRHGRVLLSTAGIRFYALCPVGLRMRLKLDAWHARHRLVQPSSPDTVCDCTVRYDVLFSRGGVSTLLYARTAMTTCTSWPVHPTYELRETDIRKVVTSWQDGSVLMVESKSILRFQMEEVSSEFLA